MLNLSDLINKRNNYVQIINIIEFACYLFGKGYHVFGSVSCKNQWIAMKFYGGIRGGKRNKWLNLGGNLDHHMLTAQSESRPLLNKLRSDFDENFGIVLQSHMETVIIFWGDLDHHADSPNRESGQYGVMSYLIEGRLNSLSTLVLQWFYVVFSL